MAWSPARARWPRPGGTAHAILGPGGTGAQTEALSCASAGNCSAGGEYYPASGSEPLVVTETNGTWGKALAVPGMAKLNTGGDAAIVAISCTSPGNCSAGGWYSVASTSDNQSFVVQEANGTWGKARELPGIATPTGNGYSVINSVSCASAGNCGAIGTEWNGSTGFDQAFVVNQTSGTWGKPQIVPGVTKLSGEEISFADPNDCFDGNCITISCVSAGNCSAGGSYQGGSVGDPTNAFVVTETGGTWGKAIEVPGTAKLNTAVYGGTYALSCASASACSVGGWYRTVTSAGGFAAPMPAAAAAGSRLTPGLPAPSPHTAATLPARVPVPRALTATRRRMAGIWPVDPAGS